MSDRILAVDQGTTGTTCLVVEMEAGRAQILGRGYAELPQHFPQPGWVEHDLGEIWESTRLAVRDVLTVTGTRGEQIAAVGITNQRETTGVWTVGGDPVHHAIVWQDRRTANRCERLVRDGHTDLVRERTGLVIDPYFSGTKIGWLLDEVESLRGRAERGELRFGTMDTWLVWQLTGGRVHTTDATNASRTLLFDIHNNRWDEDLCRAVGDVPASMLPEVRGSAEIYGRTRDLGFLPDGIPIAGMAGDQQAALFGQACFEPGMAKCTYGTGAFALVNTGSEPVASGSGLVTTIAWRLGDTTTYAIEGSAFVAGAVVQWLRDGLGLFSSSADIEALAASVPDSGGVMLVPALAGLGAPHWRPEARGLLGGFTRGTTRAHVARAALEGIAFQILDLLTAMHRDSQAEISVLRVDGGAAANDLLMQFQADILGVTIHRPEVLETTALGAAYLAALGAGVVSDPSEISAGWRLERSFEPNMPAGEIETRVAAWREAVAKA